MRRPWLILLAGFAAAGLAFASVYFAGTAGHHRLEHSQSPELAWLKDEFHLSDTEFARVSQMHEEYLVGCAERCRQIDEKNRELARLLAATNTVTPAIEQLLLDSARMRAQCQQKMLEHFYAVSRTMPPAQGQRYLAWVQSQTIVSDTHATMHH
jgi:hypothetical protein